MVANYKNFNKKRKKSNKFQTVLDNKKNSGCNKSVYETAELMKDIGRCICVC